MFKSIHHRILTRFLTNRSQLCKRSFLSESFKCTEAWDNRLKSPVLRNLQFGNLYNGLMNSFATGQRINVLDIDLFANGITNEFYHKELEEILLKLREIPETTIMYESTAHAVVRWYLSRNDKAELLNILAQRLTFGIFPDIYLSTLMIDKFLKEGDSISATKVAVLQMLQEDCNHPILRSLSLYSCLKYLESSNVWETPVEEKVDEDEEVVKVRVNFLRNEYFDDHFDIVNTNHLVGKTMVAYGKALGGPVGFSNQLIGWVLYEKYEEAEHLLNHIIENKLPIYKEVTEIVNSYINKTPKQLADKTEEDGKSDGNLESKNNVKTLLKNLDCQILIDGNLLQALEEVVRNEIKEHEESIIHKQCEVTINFYYLITHISSYKFYNCMFCFRHINNGRKKGWKM